jgi:hypothetical protein
MLPSQMVKIDLDRELICARLAALRSKRQAQ